MLTAKLFAFVIISIGTLGCRTVSPRGVSELRHDPTGEKGQLMQAVSDLTDLYVFPSATKSGAMVLALNMMPLKKEHAFFSDRVNYIFYLREIVLDKRSQDSKLKARELGEKVIMCWFQTPQDEAKHRGSCTLPRFGEISGKFGDVVEAGNVSFFHGLRRDPYVANLNIAKKVLGGNKGIFLRQKTGATVNTLSIVLEFNVSEIFGRDVKWLGVAAQSYTTSSAGQQKPLDRVGRPSLAIVLDEDEKGSELLTKFKGDRPFAVADANRLSYRELVMEQLAKLDNVDGRNDWDGDGRASLADIIVDDYILVDLGKTQKTTKFFGVEEAVLNKKESTSYGGRSLLDDTFGSFLGFTVSRKLSDRPNTLIQKKTASKFPYLDEPDPKWVTPEGKGIRRPNVQF